MLASSTGKIIPLKRLAPGKLPFMQKTDEGVKRRNFYFPTGVSPLPTPLAMGWVSHDAGMNNRVLHMRDYQNNIPRLKRYNGPNKTTLCRQCSRKKLKYLFSGITLQTGTTLNEAVTDTLLDYP